MKEIGGYFELELPQLEEYHSTAIRLNTGRNAFEYILAANHQYSRIFLPYYTCDVLLQPIKKMGIQYEFYPINENLDPIFDFSKIGKHDAFLYTNYFGLKADSIQLLSNTVNNLIIDNAQAFYELPINQIDTFYSARKFFGVPDGAYLYCKKKLDKQFERDESYNRFNPLIKRIDVNANFGYDELKNNEALLNNQPIKQMSPLTQRMLSSIDYKRVAKTRRENFIFLHDVLHNRNQLQLKHSDDTVSMAYPFLAKNNLALRKKLIDNKIYTAQYWTNVKEWTGNNSFEYYLTENLICLPIDQRYNIEDLKIILELLK